MALGFGQFVFWCHFVLLFGLQPAPAVMRAGGVVRHATVLVSFTPAKHLNSRKSRQPFLLLAGTNAIVSLVRSGFVSCTAVNALADGF